MLRNTCGVGGGRLVLAVSNASAAWIGDVPDLVNPIMGETIGKGTVVRGFHRAGVQLHREAYSWATEGDTLLMGPGLYQEWNAIIRHPATPPWTWTKTINLYGSGSGADANTNTVWPGWRDPNTGDARRRVHHAQGPRLHDAPELPPSGLLTDLINLQGGAVAPGPAPGRHVQQHGLPERRLSQHAAGLGQSRLGRRHLIKEGTNSLIVQNCLFDGGGNTPQTGGDMIGIRFGGTLQQNNNGVIDGCTFTNMKAGIVFNGYKATNWKITNNTFSNMTKQSGTDVFNTWGNAGIVIYPRHNTTAGTEDASVNNWYIMSNTFKDCGYLADEADDPNPAPLERIFYHEAGIGVTLCSGTSAQNIWINHNTFADTRRRRHDEARRQHCHQRRHHV